MSREQQWIDVSQFIKLKRGEMIDFDYDEKKIVILNINGKFFASDRICTHASIDMIGGSVNENAKTITCPLHLSSFDLNSGNPLNLPAEKPIHIYQIRKEKNKLLILL
ncbi:MAG TPA: Rieske 2Fe-2S domain-containing protein [Candidatus Saccharimonadales bacterium]|nr:Rieske 2Fe-2S domain-containing protein [Candidatus Saccharimonadales bacterium]